MSSSLTQEPDASSTSMAQVTGPIFAENPSTFTSSTFSGVTPSQAVSAATAAPQFVETIAATPSQSSQPLLTILVAPPTSSLESVLASSPTSSGNSVSLSSTPVLLLTVTPTPTATTTVLASAESSSAEIPLASETPTATTVTQAIVQVPSSSASQAAGDTTVTEGGHHAPFYIAVIVGTILAIGLIAAVIAWAVRLRMHARRRRESPLVPWANHHEEHCELEAARDATFIGQPINRSGSKDISSQDVIPWEPCGDRDVGEPKRPRSGSCVRSSIHSSLAPGPAPYPVQVPNVAYPSPYYHGHVTRDANLSSEGSLDEYHSSASSLGPLQVANRTPGDTSPFSSCTSTPVNLYTGHVGGTGTSDHSDHGTRLNPFSEPYASESIPRSDIPWSRNTDETWNTAHSLGRTQNPSQETISDDSHSWTASLKSNFTYAFNTVAANLPSGAALMINREDKNLDNLSPRPTQSSGRRSLFSTFSPSRSDNTARDPWTLEERSDGTGRVLFHDVEANANGDSIHGLTASKSQLVAARTSTRDSFSSPLTQPLRSVMLQHDADDTVTQRGRALRQPSMRRTFSNASSCSAYSMASAISSVPRLPELSRHSTMKLDSPMGTVFEKEETDGPQRRSLKRPTTLAVARSSSSGCSVQSYYYGTEIDGAESTDGDMSKQQALVDRRRRSRRVV